MLWPCVRVPLLWQDGPRTALSPHHPMAWGRRITLNWLIQLKRFLSITYTFEWRQVTFSDVQSLKLAPFWILSVSMFKEFLPNAAFNTTTREFISIMSSHMLALKVQDFSCFKSYLTKGPFVLCEESTSVRTGLAFVVPRGRSVVRCSLQSTDFSL